MEEQDDVQSFSLTDTFCQSTCIRSNIARGLILYLKYNLAFTLMQTKNRPAISHIRLV